MNKSASLNNIFSCIDDDSWWLFFGDNDSFTPFRPSNITLETISKLNRYNNLNHKHYIKIGEECPICLNPILHRKEAYLTDCAHSFHCHCIASNYNTNYEYGYKCPICRQDVGIFDDCKHRYSEDKCISNSLDKLEDFWNNIDTDCPHKCYYVFSNGDTNYRTVHDLGMKQNCKRCKIYRTTGEIWGWHEIVN